MRERISPLLPELEPLTHSSSFELIPPNVLAKSLEEGVYVLEGYDELENLCTALVNVLQKIIQTACSAIQKGTMMIWSSEQQRAIVLSALRLYPPFMFSVDSPKCRATGHCYEGQRISNSQGYCYCWDWQDLAV